MDITKILKGSVYLQKAVKYIIANNGDSTFNPYHNLNHNFTVLYFSHLNGEALELSETEMKELTIAAIFHDFKHSGGKLTDDKNIELAKEGVKNFIEEYNIDVDIDKVNEIINATQYPYMIDDESLTVQQTIIRDADLMQLFEPTRVQSNILGLAKEIGVDYKTMLKNQRAFVKGVKFKTLFGNMVKGMYPWDDIIEELDLLIDIEESDK